VDKVRLKRTYSLAEARELCVRQREACAAEWDDDSAVFCDSSAVAEAIREVSLVLDDEGPVKKYVEVSKVRAGLEDILAKLRSEDYAPVDDIEALLRRVTA